MYTDKDGELHGFTLDTGDYSNAKEAAMAKPDFDKLHTIFETHTTPQGTTHNIYMYQ